VSKIVVGKVKENGNIIMKAEETKVSFCKCNNYELYVPNDPKLKTYAYIIGYSVKEKFNKKNLTSMFKDNLIIEDLKILNSIITLADNIFRLQRTPIEKEVINWCKKYGMPFVGNYIIEDLTSSLDIFDSVGYLAFSLDEFIEKLWELYHNYIGYCAKKDNLTFDLKNLRIGFNETGNLSISHIEDRFFNINLNNREKEIEKLLNSINIKYEFKHIKGKLTMIPKIENIISLAIYQLGLLMISNDEMLAKHCERCTSVFNATRNNNIYCPNCTPQKRWNDNNKASKGGAK